MILRKADGITLYYVDASGAEISTTPGQWERYSAMLATQTLQQQAATDDVQALATYQNQLALYQTDLNIGRAQGIVPPLMPQHKVVDDATSAISYVPFVPPLPVAVAPNMGPPSGPIAATNPPADRTDTIIQMQLLLLASVNAIKTKLGA